MNVTAQCFPAFPQIQLRFDYVTIIIIIVMRFDKICLDIFLSPPPHHNILMAISNNQSKNVYIFIYIYMWAVDKQVCIDAFN